MTDEDKKYITLALEQAQKSVTEGGFPAGAVIVKDGKLLSEGISIGFSLHDPTGHAETSAIREACQKLNTVDLSGAILYESLECCNMCFSVAYWAGISKIVYACKKNSEMVEKFYYEGMTDNQTLNETNNRKIELLYLQEFEQESLKIIQDWEAKGGFTRHKDLL